jgi:hypothetical protein
MIYSQSFEPGRFTNQGLSTISMGKYTRSLSYGFTDF